jgi:hypothetical protein
VPARFCRRNPPPSAVPCTAGQGGKTNTSIATTSGGLCLSVEALPVTRGASSTAAEDTSPTPASAYTEVIDLPDIAAAQAAWAAAQAACAAATNSPSLKLKIFEEEGVSLLYDTSTGAARPLVPAPHRWSSLLYTHRQSSLLYTHRRSSLLSAHRQSSLLYTHRRSSQLRTSKQVEPKPEPGGGWACATAGLRTQS